MSKYINADELAEKYLEEENCYPTDDYFEGYLDGIIFSHHMLDEMPSADVVKVVRCKDCIYYDMEDDIYGICCKPKWSKSKKPDGFCDEGERKETE